MFAVGCVLWDFEFFLCLHKRGFNFLPLLYVPEKVFAFHFTGGKWLKLLDQQHPAKRRNPWKAEWWLHSSCQDLNQWLVEKLSFGIINESWYLQDYISILLPTGQQGRWIVVFVMCVVQPAVIVSLLVVNHAISNLGSCCGVVVLKIILSNKRKIFIDCFGTAWLRGKSMFWSLSYVV